MKRLGLLMAAMAFVLLLSGCSIVTDSRSGTDSIPTLAPAISLYEAPVEFSGMDRQITATLYLPSRDGQRLLAQYVSLTLTPNAIAEETIVRALLAYPMNQDVQPLGRGVTVLGLFGQHPVEISGSVCTVNLSSSVLQLDYREQYDVCLSIAATVSAMGRADYVNILVADQPISLDITGNLPAGSTAAHPGGELAVLWDQMDARRTPLGQDPAVQPLSSVATLYFPLEDFSGFVAETRTLSFSGQRADVMTMGLLNALSAGAQYLERTAPMPDIASLMAKTPEVEELADGGRQLKLFFVNSLEKRLELLGMDPACFLSAVVYTVSTFVPGVSGVYLYSGNEPVILPGRFPTENGLVRRSQLTDLEKIQQTIYLPRGNRLAAVTKAASWDLIDDPTLPAVLWMKGPDSRDRVDGILPAISDEMDETDILGMRIEGDMLLVDLSPRFERLLCQAGTEEEQLTCYSLINTLCTAMHTNRVTFFFHGEMREYLGGSIYWGGEFRENRSFLEN